MICWDIRLQRRVAIKQIPLYAQNNQNATSYQDALDEARASSFLSHENIVVVHDFISDDEFCYLIMEYVDGMTLSEIMARVEDGVLTPNEAAAIATSLASALAYAHENGVLHLDIKPANIMIDTTGAVKLCDFGIANLASAAGYDGAKGGTVGFMPPEQLDGTTVDERTDIFSLALVIYQMLAGENPFSASTPLQSKRLIKKGAPLEAIPDEVATGAVLDGLSSALSTEPDDRQDSVEELQKQLISALGDPQAGKESLASLIASDDEAEDFDTTSWSALDPPAKRLHWIAPVATRLANVICAALFMLFLITLAQTSIAGMIHDAWLDVALVVGAAVGALFIPTVSALIELWGFACLLIAQNPCTVTVLAGIATVALISYWAFTTGAYQQLSATSILIAPTLQAQTVSPGYAGYIYTPAKAFCTAAVGSFCAALVSACITTQRDTDPLHYSEFMLSNPVWITAVIILALFAGFGALLASAITTHAQRIARQQIKQTSRHLPYRGWLVCAQLVGGGCMGAGLAVANGLINLIPAQYSAYLWSSATPYSVVQLARYAQSGIQISFLSAVLVISCVLMCVIVMLFGLPARAKELDEITEGL